MNVLQVLQKLCVYADVYCVYIRVYIYIYNGRSSYVVFCQMGAAEQLCMFCIMRSALFLRFHLPCFWVNLVSIQPVPFSCSKGFADTKKHHKKKCFRTLQLEWTLTLTIDAFSHLWWMIQGGLVFRYSAVARCNFPFTRNSGFQTKGNGIIWSNSITSRNIQHKPNPMYSHTFYFSVFYYCPNYSSRCQFSHEKCFQQCFLASLELCDFLALLFIEINRLSHHKDCEVRWPVGTQLESVLPQTQLKVFRHSGGQCDVATFGSM